MSVSLNTGTVTANISGSVSVGGTPTSFVKTLNTIAFNAGATTIGTVTAGKTWYITGGSLTMHSQGGLTDVTAVISIDGVTIHQVRLAAANTTSVSNTSQIILPPGFALQALATKVIAITLTNTTSATINSVNLQYIEV